jgi:hypothetical protein
MNKKFLAILVAFAFSSQSMRAGCLDDTREILTEYFVRWPKALMPELRFDKETPAKHDGKKYQIADGVTYNGDYIEVGADGKVNGVAVPNAFFIEKAAKKVTAQDQIDKLFHDEVQGKDSPANAFRWFKLQHIQKRWFFGSSAAIILGLGVAAKKGYDLYQERAAQQAAVDFDAFEDEEESDAATSAAPQPQQQAAGAQVSA